MKYKYPEITKSPEYGEIREELKKIIKNEGKFRYSINNTLEKVIRHNLVVRDDKSCFILKPEKYDVLQVHSPSFFKKRVKKLKKGVHIEIYNAFDKLNFLELRLGYLDKTADYRMYNIFFTDYAREFKVSFLYNLMQYFGEFLKVPKSMPMQKDIPIRLKDIRRIQEMCEVDLIFSVPDFSALNPVVIQVYIFDKLYKKLWKEIYEKELLDKFVEIYMNIFEEFCKKEKKEFSSLSDLYLYVKEAEECYKPFRKRIQEFIVKEKNFDILLVEKVREIILRTEEEIREAGEKFVSDKEKYIREYLSSCSENRDSTLDFLREEVKIFVKRILEDNTKQEDKFREIYVELKDRLNKDNVDVSYLDVINQFMSDLKNISIYAIKKTPVSRVLLRKKFESEEDLLIHLYDEKLKIKSGVEGFYFISNKLLKKTSEIFEGVSILYPENLESEDKEKTIKNYYSLSEMEKIYMKISGLLDKIVILWGKYFREPVDAGEALEAKSWLSEMAKAKLSKFKLIPDKGYMIEDEHVEKHKIFEYMNEFIRLMDCIITKLKSKGVKIPLELDEIN